MFNIHPDNRRFPISVPPQNPNPINSDVSVFLKKVSSPDRTMHLPLRCIRSLNLASHAPYTRVWRDMGQSVRGSWLATISVPLTGIKRDGEGIKRDYVVWVCSGRVGDTKVTRVVATRQSPTDILAPPSTLFLMKTGWLHGSLIPTCQPDFF